MGINFPASPTVGQKYPQPAVAGIPVYTWDGEKWTTVGGSIAAYAPPADAVPLMDATPGLVGTSTDYAREDHVHPTDSSLASVTSLNTGIVGSLAYSGMQINGGMEVSQELGTAGTNVSTKFICDGWKLLFNGTMVINSAQQTQPYFPGIPYYLQMVPSTIQTTLGAGDAVYAAQIIEGYRIARLAWGSGNAQPITISFWTMHSLTGVYSVSVHNANSDRSYVASYTHAVSNVPQYNTVTVAGDASGTWPTGNGGGLYVSFYFAAGSTNITSSVNTWLAGNYGAASGQVNGAASGSNVFRITGVTVLPGTQAPTAAQSPNIMRPYDQELVTCMRYYRKTNGDPGTEPTMYNGYAASAAITVGLSMPYPVPMRASPTVTLTGTWTTTNCGQPVIAGSNEKSYGVYVVATAAGNITFQPNNSGIVKFDARL